MKRERGEKFKMEYRIVNGELYHWGKKGMKWGVRRYQNKDGTLTPAGKKRYARDAREQGYKNQDDSGTYYKVSGKKNKRTDLDIDANRYVKEDLTRSKRLVDETTQMTGKLKNLSDSSIRNQKKAKMDLSNMTDKEMRDQINRALLERQYNDMFAPQKSTRGREFASRTLETAGNVLAVGASALGIALAIKELKG